MVAADHGSTWWERPLPKLREELGASGDGLTHAEARTRLKRYGLNEFRGPQAWDMTFIRNFMWIIGPVSSLFDFLTFYVLLAVLNANEVLFQTGWFVESLATQVLVIFVIRTRRNPLSSRPHAALAATSLAVVLTALILPFTGLGRYFGFQPPPVEFFVILAALVVAYLGIVEAAKRIFYRHLTIKPK
jgi:Mg2+-importing ATPase